MRHKKLGKFKSNKISLYWLIVHLQFDHHINSKHKQEMDCGYTVLVSFTSTTVDGIAI